MKNNVETFLHLFIFKHNNYMYTSIYDFVLRILLDIPEPTIINDLVRF